MTQEQKETLKDFAEDTLAFFAFVPFLIGATLIAHCLAGR